MTDSKILLPGEIVGIIFQHLSINSIEMLLQNADTKPRNSKYMTKSSICVKELKRRLDPVLYLSKYFSGGCTLDGQYISYGDLLLEAMYNCGCILTGSRALELLIPNSVEDDSDWNFFILPGKVNILYMMQSLEEIGVVWETGDERLTRLSKSINSHDDFIGFDNNLERQILLDSFQYKQCFEFGTIPDTTTIKGILKNHNKNVNISLTFSNEEDTPLKMIKRMSHTAIQCFISAIGIGHFYYSATLQRKTHKLIDSKWDDAYILYDSGRFSEVDTTSLRYKEYRKSFIGKYEKRGYPVQIACFDKQKEYSISRSLSDKNAKFYDISMPYVGHDAKRRVLSTTWYQFQDCIIHYDNSFEAYDKAKRMYYDDIDGDGGIGSYYCKLNRKELEKYYNSDFFMGTGNYGMLQSKYGLNSGRLNLYNIATSPIYI